MRMYRKGSWDPTVKPQTPLQRPEAGRKLGVGRTPEKRLGSLSPRLEEKAELGAAKAMSQPSLKSQAAQGPAGSGGPGALGPALWMGTVSPGKGKAIQARSHWNPSLSILIQGPE